MKNSNKNNKIYLILSLLLFISYVSCNKFAYGVKCSSQELRYLDKIVPENDKCFSQSLYFTNLNNICNNECKSAAIKSSQFIQKYCPVPYPTKEDPLFSNSVRAYSVWSNETYVNLICQEYNYRPCLSYLTSAQVFINNAEVTQKPIDKNKVCVKCVTDIVKKIDPYKLPMVYYNMLLEPHILFDKYSKYCLN